MMKKISFLVTVLSIFLFTCCSDPQQYYEERGRVFGTTYSIKYESYKPLTEKIEAEFEAFNLSLNPFNPNSIIAKVNNNEETEVDSWFTEVFNKSQEIADNSNGAFDPTIAPLINLWGFGFNKMDSVTPQMVDSLLTFVGYKKIRLEGNKIVKDDPRILLNFSAIAKGYASDVIASLLEQEGVENYMVEIGGEVAMKGVNPNRACWKIGINEPEDDITGITQGIHEVVQPCKKCGVATSGDYRNFYIKDGQKYAHTINPRTGYPANQEILSATIVAENCMIADGYATAFMTMGVEDAVHMAQSISDKIEYYIIYMDEKGFQSSLYSPGMIPYMPNRKELSILENP